MYNLYYTLNKCSVLTKFCLYCRVVILRLQYRCKLRQFKLFILLDVLFTILIVLAIVIVRIFIEGKTIGFVLTGLIILSLFNITFCIFSLIAINKGRSGLVTRLWLAMLSIVLFYFLLDIVGGHIFLSKHRNDSTPIPDKILHHRTEANTSSRDYIPGDYDVSYKNNNLGYRGRSGSEEKMPSTYRILMLGDSFTFAPGVHDDETACYLLEDYLNKNSEKHYEVINLGVDSYAPILEYLQLKTYIGMMKPDMVIMNFDMSDLVQDYMYRQEADFDKSGEPLAVNGYPDFVNMHETIKARILNWVHRQLFITTALIELSHKYFGQEVKMDKLNLENTVMRKNKLLLQHTLKDSSLSSQEFNKYISTCEDSILRAKKLCDKQGAEFILTTYPWGHQVNDTEWIPGKYSFLPESYEISDRTVDELARFSKENGIPFFSAFPDFRAYRGHEQLYYNNDMHFTRYGQKLWAQSLYKFVTEYISYHSHSDNRKYQEYSN